MRLLQWVRPRVEIPELDSDATDKEIENWAERLFRQTEEKSLFTIQKQRRRALRKERRTRTGFERRLKRRWGKAFDSFDVFRAYALDIGQYIQKDRFGDQELVEDHTYEALFRLHARGCLIASEIRALMAAGHASGALTRWRSLHELAVISIVLKEHGNDLSERYLLHSTVKMAKHMRQYQKHAERLGLVPFDPVEVEAIERESALLVERFGERFSEDYGWASLVLKGNVRFDAIERAAGLDHWRPYFGLASESVHGGFRGMIADIGNMGSPRAAQLMLAGPSNAGLADPGQCAAISLSTCTTYLVSYHPKPEYVVMMNVLHRLLEQTVSDFIEAHAKLERDEARYSSF